MKTILQTLALSVLAAIATAAPLTLVEDGQPRASIVVAVNEPPAQKAAEEIQKYIEKMSGARLAIVSEDKVPSDPEAAIYVGRTAAARKLGLKIPAGFDPSIRPDFLEEEGYLLKTHGKVVLAGGNSDGPYQGTLYAAYALLEKLGCRWFFPGEWGEVIPQQKTVIVPDLDVVSRPDFALRSVWMSGWVPLTKEEGKAYQEWSLRIGMTPGHKDTYPQVGDGSLGYLLPPGEYLKTHPEFYAMDKSGNRIPPKNKAGVHAPQFAMFCLSNPAVVDECIANIRAAFAGKKNVRTVVANGVGISPPDGAPFCYCEKCEAANQNFNFPNYVQERMQSEEFFGFAARVAREFPDKWVSTYAYSLREVPPQGVKFPRNIFVKIAPISCCALHGANVPTCWRRQEEIRIVRQWRRLTSHLVLRDYDPHLLTGVFVPENEAANVASVIPAWKEIGVKGMNREGRKIFMQTWLSYYLTARLLWNAKTDVAALKKDFYEKFFGAEAGPHVQAWWDACEDALTKAAIHVHEDWLLNSIYTAEFVKGIRRHLEAARKVRMTPAQSQRLAMVLLIADHLDAYAAMHAAEKQLDYALAAREARRMLEIKKKIEALNPFFYTYGEKREQRNTFTGGHITRYEKLAALIDGREGKLVAPLPLEMKFARDPWNAGVFADWHRPEFDDRKWGAHDTYRTWDAQEPAEDAEGHDYNGYGWYRGTVKVPAEFAGKPVRLWLGGAINEAWIWINGEYVGHKLHQLWWTKEPDFDLDVTSAIKPGQDNAVAIRLLNSVDVGGLYRRGFFWSPKEGIPLPEAGKVSKKEVEPEPQPE